MNNLCILGCGQKGLFENQTRRGEWRCSKNVSGCPEMRRLKAIKFNATMQSRAEVKHAELEAILANPQPCDCGKIGVYYSARKQKWRCYNRNTDSRKCDAVINQYETTMLERHGTTSMAHIAGVQDRRREYLIDFHASKTPEERKETDIKRQSTMMDRYGVINASQLDEVRKKIEDNNLEKYGMRHVLQVPEIRQEQKRVDTMVTLFGGRSAMSSPEVFRKQQASLYRFKDFQLPSGNIVEVQGYEPMAITYLLAEGFNEDDLVFDSTLMPKIVWLDEKLTTHRYNPDIFIPSINHIIEVKSPYTFDVEYAKNMSKRDGTLSAGYKFTFMIFDNNGDLTCIGDDIPKGNPNPKPLLLFKLRWR